MKFALALVAIVAAEEAAKKKAGEACAAGECEDAHKCCNVTSDDDAVTKAIKDAGVDAKKCVADSVNAKEWTDGTNKANYSCGDGAKALAATALAALAVAANL